MSKNIVKILSNSEFKLDKAGQLVVQQWEVGFEALFSGLPLPEKADKHCRHGWECAKAVKRFREQLSHG